MPPRRAEFIYKIVPAEHWEAAKREGIVSPMPIDTADGYMHFSTGSQLGKTLELYFAGQKNIKILAVAVKNVEAELKWEPSRGGDLFPHLYAPLPLDQVIWHETVDVNADGNCTLPERIV